MTKQSFLLLLFCIIIILGVRAQETDSLMIRKIYDEALTNGKSYELLGQLCNEIGSRLSGSPEADRAVEWARMAMQSLGLGTVYLQEVMVPHWVRGDKEVGKIISSKTLVLKELPVCALGGSIGTGKDGIIGNVIEVYQFEELEKLGREKIEGNIVFYNRPMDPKYISTFDAYSKAVGQRWAGAIRASKYGAVGVIVRSLTLKLDDFPHTGSMGYRDTVKKIPAAAISTKGADFLSKRLKVDRALKFHLKMNCETLPEKKSYNVIAEMKGSEFPDEIIVVGGHLDSWDMGDGAHDDGAGCVQSIEVLRIFRALNIKPKRTIRAVMFMNEENGLKGAKKYAEEAKLKKEKHIAAIESDAGAFSPRGFGIETDDSLKLAKILEWKSLFAPYGLHEIGIGYGGADISKLKDQNVVLIGLRPDSQRYFDYHHADSDTFDKINKRELELGGAAMAALVYLLSEHGLK
ncbi:M20/M25/M40 family metallo-hydrolase [Candidatus Amoebophilus asiaticus]|nr:M20/M25/M40 family metallo-hydrolase [Candidatus Amoebophilus asiaticus]